MKLWLYNGRWNYDSYNISVTNGSEGSNKSLSYGVNIGWPDRASRNNNVINEVKALGTRIVRMDIRNRDGQGLILPPSHYANFIDQLASNGINVLAVFTGASWDGEKTDILHARSQSSYRICNHYYPTSWGHRNVMPYLQAISPYVDA
ncbi:MAG: hypothetical protein CUN55_18825, partial [Phototrophicales bacterium]